MSIVPCPPILCQPYQPILFLLCSSLAFLSFPNISICQTFIIIIRPSLSSLFFSISFIFLFRSAIFVTEPQTIYAPSAAATTSVAKNKMALTFTIYFSCCLVILATERYEKGKKKKDKNNNTNKRSKKEVAPFSWVDPGQVSECTSRSLLVMPRDYTIFFRIPCMRPFSGHLFVAWMCFFSSSVFMDIFFPFL